jgi:cellulose synthase/poly-beta-1,6-N-acetylglucosamine synthase-like glycosyltransferase
MSITVMIIFVVLCVYLLGHAVLLTGILSVRGKAPDHTPGHLLPNISVLVAARNEELTIINCLEALGRMDYPHDKLEILVGNDGSEDRTAELVRAYSEHKPYIRLIDITGTLGKAKGKANVLAHLAHEASAELFLITDADITVNTRWAREMVAYFTGPDKGIISGFTVVDGTDPFARFQQIDWMYFMGLVQGFTNIGLHCTAVGNNMAISRQAYFDVGGYEHLDFSITEDYKLFREVRRKGWKTTNVLNRRSVNRSAATRGLLNLMHQRKRWLTGARELPAYWWGFFILFGSFLPLVIVLAFLNLPLALVCYISKLVLQSATIIVLQQKAGIRQPFIYIIFYEIYTTIVSGITQIFFILPLRFKWKGRTYLL